MTDEAGRRRRIVIVGAGAAGLATAIFAARANPKLSIALLDGAEKIGAKILISGGGRCNITNVKVTPEDYWGGSRNTIKRVLAALSEEKTAAFFREIGVPLHEEQWGKLFPDSNQARSVLDALVREAKHCGVELKAGHRVTAIAKGFKVATSKGELEAERVVLATGGLSIPKTGSDGGGYALAKSLGHSIIPTTPALAPLTIERTADLAGVTHEVELTVRVDGGKETLLGSMLWTHFGVSGPVAMNASRVWHRAKVENRPVTVTANFAPGVDIEAELLRSKGKAANVIAKWIPSRLAEKLAPDVMLSHLTKEQRRDLVRAVTEFPMGVTGTRGYNYAEATAGGVPLDEIDPRTMESRLCPGLHFVGEILDVDGRIGGFNFQWAWSSGFVAGNALARTP